MKRLLFVLLILISGCAMSNEAIIKEYDKCRNAGLGTHTLRDKITDSITKVQCQP